MGHRLLDCFGLLALVLYILGALSFYPLLLFGPHAHTDVAFELLLLLPPIFAGAGAREFLRRRGKERFAPRRLAVDALGAGLGHGAPHGPGSDPRSVTWRME